MTKLFYLQVLINAFLTDRTVDKFPRNQIGFKDID